MRVLFERYNRCNCGLAVPTTRRQQVDKMARLSIKRI